MSQLTTKHMLAATVIKAQDAAVARGETPDNFIPELIGHLLSLAAFIAHGQGIEHTEFLKWCTEAVSVEYEMGVEVEFDDQRAQH